ncbi:LysR family transcriptional regulator [Bdellovibrio bacteriovorus]|uniref:LysR family transcriptional regulator n=1 Tax=Bdellovibrio TaxID=958 RepID=UPI0035A832C6
MKISNLGLQAFAQTALNLNITQAAKELGLTQSALSQRITQLENELEVTLFIREPRGLKLTEAGERLLRFSSLNQKMEEELLTEFKGSKEELAGSFRLAGYSSVLRSVIIPALSPFLRKNPKVHVDFQSYEMFELPDILNTARADMIVMDYQWKKKGIAEHILGHEEFVVIESTKHDTASDLYLDHGPLDNATEEFFKAQTRAPKSLRRSFMGDVYGIIDGVELGLGRAVMSRHLIEDNKHVRTVAGYAKYKRPVTLHYFEQPYYSRLMTKVLTELQERVVL